MKYLSLLIAFVLLSCSPSHKDLYMHTRTIDGDMNKDTFHIFNSEYFEITTKSITARNGSEKYVAEKDLEKAQMVEGFHTKYLFIVNEKDSIQYLPDGSAFLSYMSDHGCDMVTQKENKYGADYTFKRTK